MAERDRIAHQLTSSLRGEAWHGPALTELLDDVDATAAAAHPIAGAHSIWEIVLHLTAWAEVVRRRLHGERIVDLPPERDWPAAPEPSPAPWRESRERLEIATGKLRDTILSLDEARLSEEVPGKRDTVYVNLQGVVQHNAYHGGQIAILKKAFQAGV